VTAPQKTGQPTERFGGLSQKLLKKKIDLNPENGRLIARSKVERQNEPAAAKRNRFLRQTLATQRDVLFRLRKREHDL
jgi:hypothetical protein